MGEVASDGGEEDSWHDVNDGDVRRLTSCWRDWDWEVGFRTTSTEVWAAVTSLLLVTALRNRKVSGSGRGKYLSCSVASSVCSFAFSTEHSGSEEARHSADTTHTWASCDGAPMSCGHSFMDTFLARIRHSVCFPHSILCNGEIRSF